MEPHLPAKATPVLGQGIKHANLLAVAEGWVARALTKHVPELEVVWAVAMEALPSPSETNPAWVPSLLIYLEIGMGSEAKSDYITHLLPPFDLTRETVMEVVRADLEQLQQARRARLEQDSSGS